MDVDVQYPEHIYLYIETDTAYVQVSEHRLIFWLKSGLKNRGIRPY